MKSFNVVRKYGAGAVLASLAGSAAATVPTEVTAALTAMSADTMTVAGAFLALAILVAAYMFMRKGAK